MKATPDTNVLVRVLVKDDPPQAALAQSLLHDAELVALTLPALCKLAWVLGRSYALSKANIAIGIRALLGGANVEADRPAVEAGLAALDAGEDFADAVMAHEGSWLGAETFVSFDKRAVRLITTQGGSAQLL